MRKIISILVLVLILSHLSQASHYFGTYGTGTEVDDTCRLCFSTFDTLGHSANPSGDSIYILRFSRGALLDSTSAAKLRDYYWCVTKKAYDGSNLGGYAVACYWRPCQGKWYNDDGHYVVEPETTHTPRIDYILASGQAVKVDGGYVGECTTVVNDVGITQAGADRVWNTTTRALTDKAGFSLSGSGIDDIWDEDSMGHNTAGSYGEVLESRGTSDLTASDNIGINWNDIENEYAFHYFSQTSFLAVDSNRTEKGELDPDSVANHVWIWSDRTLTSGQGGGAYQVTITTKQTSDSAEISGAQVQILNLTQTSTLGILSTNASGKATFALDDDTLSIRMYKPGWIFDVPETLIVSGNTDTIYYADLFDPGSPPSASLCRVYGWIKDIQNLPLSGAKIEASIKAVPLKYQGVVISPYFKSTTTDSEGYWYLDLYPNSRLSPDTTEYEFLIYSTQGTILRLKALVLEQSSWELSF
jgi:hypothetical protein